MTKRKKVTQNLLPLYPLAYTLAQFCTAHSISRSHLYTLISMGQAPAIMQVGGRRLISDEAAAVWRRRMERMSPPPDNDNDDDGEMLDE